MRSGLVKIVAAVVAVVAMLGFTACTIQDTTGQQQENQTRQSNYDKLVQAQPAKQIQDYSPTRETKNFWIDTWGDKPGKLSYVYLMNSSGTVIGYYIFKGLPVSYCTSLVPPYQIVDRTTQTSVVVPAPSMDGTYSSSANCGTMYGEDATTGAYIEYTVGMGINALVYSEPMMLQNPDALTPLGFTTLDQAKKIK